jgi:CDP-diacylglycerol--serine O-phosphatidyltransferase
MRRAVVLLPNGFTLGNLFFGVWAIVAASRGSYSQAGAYVVLGGVMDALDGRVARATRTGSRFGTELDSLVDAVSFGVAPALIMYFAVLNREGWAWLFCFIFIAAVVMRLARFNVEQGGRAKTHFHGLPSPAAGMALATYYWFSQTPLYSQTVIGDLPWELVMKIVMLGLSWLMVSHVLYPAVPNINFRSWKGIVGLVLALGAGIALAFAREEFLFPALMAYVIWGLLKTVVLGFIDRMPTGDPLFEEGDEDDADRVMRPVIVGESPGRRKRRRRGRGGTPPVNRSIIEPE